jgi:hypothetical protein
VFAIGDLKCGLFNNERETTRAKFWRAKTSIACPYSRNDFKHIRCFCCCFFLSVKFFESCETTDKSYVKTMSCSGSHLGITINIKNTNFVKDLPMIDAQFRFNQCNSFREEPLVKYLLQLALWNFYLRLSSSSVEVLFRW